MNITLNLTEEEIRILREALSRQIGYEVMKSTINEGKLDKINDIIDKINKRSNVSN